MTNVYISITITLVIFCTMVFVFGRPTKEERKKIEEEEKNKSITDKLVEANSHNFGYTPETVFDFFIPLVICLILVAIFIPVHFCVRFFIG